VNLIQGLLGDYCGFVSSDEVRRDVCFVIRNIREKTEMVKVKGRIIVIVGNYCGMQSVKQSIAVVRALRQIACFLKENLTLLGIPPARPLFIRGVCEGRLRHGLCKTRPD
jgi:hypothetical protein